MRVVTSILSFIFLFSNISCNGPAQTESDKLRNLADFDIALRLEKATTFNDRQQYDSTLSILDTLTSFANADNRQKFKRYILLSGASSGRNAVEQSSAYLEKARLLLSTGDTIANQLELFIAESNNALARGYYPDALKRLQDMKMSGQWKSGPSQLQNEFLDNLARAYFSVGEYDSALYYYHALLRKQPADLYRRAIIYDAIGNIYYKKNDYASAENYLRNALSIKTDSVSPDDLALSNTYKALGMVCRKRGADFEALKFLGEAADLRKKHLGAHVSVSDCYNNIGLIYASMRQFDKALQFHKAALDIRIAAYGKSSHPDVGGSYNNIGLAYLDQLNSLEAKSYLLKALDVKKKFLGEKHQSIAHTYHNLGTVYTHLENYDSARLYFTKALDIYRQIMPGRNPDEANLHRRLGVLAFLLRKDFAEAKKEYEKALAILREIYGEKHYSMSHIYNDIAGAYVLTGAYDRAVTYAEMSVEANKITVDSQDEDVLGGSGYGDLVEYVEAHRWMSDAYWHLYKRSADHGFLDKAFTALQACDSLLGDFRRHASETQDELMQGEKFADAYEGLVRLSHTIYQHTSDEDYVRLAFAYSEKARATVLRTTLSDTEAKRNAALPTNVSSREMNLKEEIDRTKMLLMRSLADDSVSRHYSVKLFEARQNLNAFIDSVEVTYPQYYKMKYADSAALPEQIQAALRSDQAVIEYTIADSLLFSFVITKHHVSLSSQRYDAEHVRDAQLLLSSLGEFSGEPSEIYYKFTDRYRQLYQSLIAFPLQGVVGDSIKHLIIIPSKELSYIPFEILLTSDVKDGGAVGDYAALPYLLQKYSISYTQSASVMLQQRNTSRTHAFSKFYGGFAPRYDGYTDTLHLTRNAVLTFPPLEWNAKEVEQIAARTSSDYFVADVATEENFKKRVNDYNVVHLAMHASTNDTDPMKSMLVFTPGADSVEDGFLTTRELVGMEAFPELVVLSACKTGVGQINRGEGVMSLAYGFASAGCPSTVASQWQVDDKATHQLMSNFYDNLLQGLGKDEALREAKRKYLAGADPVHANPVYWAGFVLVGDWQPISLQADRNNYMILIFVSVLILGAVITYKFVKK